MSDTKALWYMRYQVRLTVAGVIALGVILVATGKVVW